MIILIPAGILLLASLAILILQQYKIKVGYSWFLAVGAGIVSWIAVLAFHWVPGVPFMVQGKSLIQNTNLDLIFQIDLFSFPYAFALISLGMVILLTDLGRGQINESSPWSWAGILAILGTGFLAIISVSPFAIIFSWTIIDLIEIIFISRSLSDNQMVQENMLAFGARVAGTMMIMVAAFYSRALGRELVMNNVLGPVGVFLLLGAGLRLGVIPLHLPYHEIGTRRGLGTILRMVGPASSLVILSRLPVPMNILGWGPWLSFFLCITMLYSSLMWLLAEDEINGRPYWIITLSSFAILCAIRSQPAASIGWGIGLILSGGILFLYSSKKLQLLFLPLLGLVGISGLPFTPVASSWKGLFFPQFDLVSFIFLVSHLFLMVGYIRHTLSKGNSYDDLDRWAQILLPFGMVILVSSEWFLGVFGWPGSFTAGNWIGNIILVGATAFIYYGNTHFQDRFPIFRNKQILSIGKTVLKTITQILSLRWLITSSLFIYQMIQKLIESLTLILEGEGGILWALLLLALVISIARARGNF